MVRKQISLLPASQALESLRELWREYQSVYLLVDDDQARGIESIRVGVGSGKLRSAPDELAFPADDVAAIAFTSGSTGSPVANPKTWGALARGGITEASRFGLLDDSTSVIVGTVPPQHMFGLETTIVMALRAGLIMHSERPFFPADLRAALSQIEAERVLVTTPVHLRALLASGIDLPALRLVICATAPLSEAMAQEVEQRYQVQVHEVYGFTEAGMVATRRTTGGSKWQLLPGVKMRQHDGRTLFSGGHVPAEVASADLIDQSDNEHFELHGRSADLVNIAGKRTSIGYLNHQLCTVAGVEDGAFFVPEDIDDTVTRLTAFAVAPGLTHQQLIEALSRRVDPVFLPRPLHLVASLPRDANGKLPRSELAKLARNYSRTRKMAKPVIVQRSIDPRHPALRGHFPGDPIVPGVVLLDEIVDALSVELGVCPDFTALTVQSAKFLRPVRAGEQLQIKFVPGDSATARFVCSVGKEIAVNGSLTLTCPAAK